MHPACLSVDEFTQDCQFQRLSNKGSRAGGQRKNKVQTAVRVTHVPTGLFAQAAERREPEANRKAAVFRLRLAVALAMRQQIAGDQPSDLWMSRCRLNKTKPKVKTDAAHLGVRGDTDGGPSGGGGSGSFSGGGGGRLSINAGHDDFPAMLAEALDVLAFFDWEVSQAAGWLKVTVSQLVKFIKLHPPAFEQLNQQRAGLGLGALR